MEAVALNGEELHAQQLRQLGLAQEAAPAGYAGIRQ